TRSWSARPPPRSVLSRSRSRTRPPGSATRASTSSARRARLPPEPERAEPEARNNMKSKAQRFEYRQTRTRDKLAMHLDRPRLSVHKTTKHLYAQVIEDNEGKTLAFAGTTSKEMKKSLKSTKNIEAAKKIGELVAQ